MAEESMRLRRARLDRGLTLKQMAAEVDISYSALCRLELGQSCPAMSALRRIHRFFGGELSIEDITSEYVRRQDQSEVA